VPRKLTPLLPALLPLLVVGIAACGGGGGNGGGGGKRLSTEDNLKVDQYKSDIEEFCNLALHPTGDLYDRALVTVVTSVDELILIYKKNTNKAFHEALRKSDIKMTALMQGEAKKLKGCSKDGKAEAAKLTQALQSG
jgi:hypothetical protein